MILMTYKIFISQPMNGHDADWILRVRDAIVKKACEKIRDIHGDPETTVELLDSFFPNFDNPLKALGKSLEVMSEADYAVFGPDWQTARGCKIEYECANQYGIPIIYVPQIV